MLEFENRDGPSATGDSADVQPASGELSSAFDKAKTSAFMRDHAQLRATGWCARYVRQGLEAGGFDTSGYPVPAADYGQLLTDRGAMPVSPESYVPQEGDVVVYDRYGKHRDGHIQYYDGRQWISDWKQRSIEPFRDVKGTPRTIYRFPGL
jgi:hypothetical protein